MQMHGRSNDTRFDVSHFDPYVLEDIHQAVKRVVETAWLNYDDKRRKYGRSAKVGPLAILDVMRMPRVEFTLKHGADCDFHTMWCCVVSALAEEFRRNRKRGQCVQYVLCHPFKYAK